MNALFCRFFEIFEFFNEWLVNLQMNQIRGERGLLGVSHLPPNVLFLQNCFFHISLMNFYATFWYVKLRNFYYFMMIGPVQKYPTFSLQILSACFCVLHNQI